jgi:DNA processing protein
MGGAEPATLQIDDWLEFIHHRCQEARDGEVIPWVSLLEQRFCGFFRVFAREINHHMKNVDELGASYLTFYCPDYPDELRNIEDPPAAITVLGTTALLTAPKVALIGSRKASNRALRETRRLANRLADEEIVVVSGGAIGCDRAAHQGCLDSQRRPVPTIAVMAGGLHQLYPRYNRQVFDQILAGGGVLLSERLCEARPRPYDFPVRNRLISGLVHRVLVMEATKRSGAIVTANLALKQGRDVMVLTSDGWDIRAAGTEQLLTDGARGFQSAEHYLARC